MEGHFITLPRCTERYGSFFVFGFTDFVLAFEQFKINESKYKIGDIRSLDVWSEWDDTDKEDIGYERKFGTIG